MADCCYVKKKKEKRNHDESNITLDLIILAVIYFLLLQDQIIWLNFITDRIEGSDDTNWLKEVSEAKGGNIYIENMLRLS